MESTWINMSQQFLLISHSFPWFFPCLEVELGTHEGITKVLNHWSKVVELRLTPKRWVLRILDLFLSQRVDDYFHQLSQKIPGISFQTIPVSKVRRCTRPFVGLQAYWRWLGPKVGSSEPPSFFWWFMGPKWWVPRPGLRRGPRVIDLDVVAVGQFPP